MSCSKQKAQPACTWPWSQLSVIIFIVVTSTGTCKNLRDCTLQAQWHSLELLKEEWELSWNIIYEVGTEISRPEAGKPVSVSGLIYLLCDLRSITEPFCVLLSSSVSQTCSICLAHPRTVELSRSGRVCKSSWKPKECYSYASLQWKITGSSAVGRRQRVSHEFWFVSCFCLVLTILNICYVHEICTTFGELASMVFLNRPL